MCREQHFVDGNGTHWHSMVFDSIGSGPARLRAWVAAALEEQPSEIVLDAKLLASELCAFLDLHAMRTGRVAVGQRGADMPTIEVAIAGDVCEADVLTCTHRYCTPVRGLVTGLSEELGVATGSAGDLVAWARLRAPG